MGNDKSENGKVLSGIGWKFAERFLAQGITFVISVILARIIAPEHYGEIAIIMVFIMIADVFVSNGLNQALIQKKNADKTDFSTIFYCSLAISVVLYVILFFTAPLISNFYNMNLTWPMRICAVKLIISAYNSVQHAYVSRHMIFRRFFFSTLIGTLVSAVVGIVMAYKGFGIWALIGQFLTNSFIDSVVLSFTVNWHPSFIFSKKSAKELLGFGSSCMFANLIGSIFNNLRTFVIGKFYPSDQVAFYNKGKNFPDLISENLTSSISSVMFPAMSNHNDDKAKVKELTKTSIRHTSYIIFPMMAGLFAVATPLITVLLTEVWIESVLFLQLATIHCALHIVTEANLQAMKAIGRGDVVLKLEFIKKPIALLLIIGAIPLGVKAMGVSLPLATFISMIVNIQPNRKLLGYGFFEQLKDLAPATILSVVMCAAVYPIQFIPMPNIAILAVQAVTGVGIYVLLSHLTKNKSYQYLLWLIKTKMPKKKKAE